MKRIQMTTTAAPNLGAFAAKFGMFGASLLALATFTGCPGTTGEDAGPTDCTITFQDPRDGSTLTTAADDNNNDPTDGVQFNVRVLTSCDNGTAITLFNDETSESVETTVSGSTGDTTTLTFTDFTITSSEGGTENILRVVASPAGQSEVSDIITITGLDDDTGGPTCRFTAPTNGATVNDADVNAPDFQIATAVACTNTAAGDEVRIQADTDASVTVTLNAQGTATAIVTTDNTGTVPLTVTLVSDPAATATINVDLAPEGPDCDATIASPADGTAFGAGSPDQSADDGFQILVRVTTEAACATGVATVSVGGTTTTGTVGANGEADVIVTIAEGASTISASVEFDGNTGTADTVNVTYTPGAIGMSFDIAGCGTFGDGCFNAAAGDSAPGSATIEQNITVFAPAVSGACPYTDPTITVEGGSPVGGATWNFDAGEDRCVATFANLTLTDDAAPDGIVVALAVTASTNDGQEEVATFNLGIDFVAPSFTITRPTEGALLNQADDANLVDGYDVSYQMQTAGMRDGALVTVSFVDPTVTLPVVETCVVAAGACTLSAALPDGDWTASTAAIDDAGNAGTQTSTFRVDATLPVVSAITVAADANDDGTINASEAGSPVSSSVTVATDLAAGATVRVTVNGTAAGNGTTGADGAVTVANVTIPEGAAVVIGAEGVDDFGNPFAEAGSSRTYLVDVTAPSISIAVPVVATDGVLLADRDTVPGTPDLQIQFAVATDEPFAAVTLDDAGGSNATVNADDTGLAVFEDFTLGQGTRSVTASVADAAGNVSTTPIYAPIVDSILPTLTIDSPASGAILNAAADADSNPSNGIQVTVTVSTVDVEVGTAVCVISSVEGEIGCAPAEGDGSVDIAVEFLTDAEHTLTAQGADINGNVGVSPAVTVTAVTGIYSLTVLTPALVGSIRGIGTAQDTDAVAPGAQAEICVDAGEALPLGTTFSLQVNGATVSTPLDFSVNATGACITHTFANSTSGTFEVLVADLGGKTGTTGSQNYSVDLTAPTVTITAPAAAAVLNIASDANVAQAGLQFAVSYTTSKAGTAVVLDSDGNTQIAAPAAVTAGARTVTVSDISNHDNGNWTVRVTDAVGNVGEASVNVTVDFSAPTISNLTLELEDRRLGLLRAVFNEPGDDGVGGGDVVSLEIVAAVAAVPNSAAFDLAMARSGSPNDGGPFTTVNIAGAGSAHSDISMPLAYGRTWTIAVRAIDNAGNTTITSLTNSDIATLLTLRANAEDDVGDGAAVDDSFGFLSAGGGDLNNDGFDDLVVAAPGEGDTCVSVVGPCSGVVRVFRGGADATGLLTLAPAEVVLPNAGLNSLGQSGMTIVPSIDSDGFDDLLVSAYADDFSTSYVAIMYGQAAAPYVDSANAALLDAGFDFLSRARYVGDVNGDDNPDIALTTFAGKVYLLFGGGAKLTGTIDLAAGGPNIAVLTSGTNFLGNAVTGVGDLNGDGFDDIVVDEAETDTNDKVFVIFGRATWPDSTTGASVDVDTSTNTPTCALKCGTELSSGDINGDGRLDLLALDSSSTRVFLQSITGTFPNSPSYSLSTGGNTTQAPRGGLFVGDVNGDGFADAVVTSRANGPQVAGYALFFGDDRTSGARAQADTFYPVPWVVGDGANISSCGNLDGSADGLPEFCFGISYSATGGLPGEVRIRH